MGNLPDDVESITGNLLQPTLELRKAAFNKLAKSWDIQYRPYLWLAIENESIESHQHSMVDFAISTLKSKSLRKMIRFAEKKQLHKRSLQRFASGFVKYSNMVNPNENQVKDTKENLIALKKSLNREKSSIHLFIYELLSNESLYINDDNSFVDELLTIIFDESIREDYRLIFTGRITARKYSFGKNDSIFEFLLTNYEDKYLIRRGIMDQLQLKDFSWDNFQGKGVENLSKYDNLLIESLKIRDEKLRYTAISILGKLTIDEPVIDEGSIETIYNLWWNMVNEDLDIKYIGMKRYSESDLKSFFIDEHENYLKEMMMFDVHPLKLLDYLLGYLPRKHLISMTREDPNQKNRALCYEKLVEDKFWINKEQKRFLGNSNQFMKILDQIIVSAKFEDDTDILMQMSRLLNYFIDLSQLVKPEFYEKIKDDLIGSELIDNLDVNTYNPVMRPSLIRLHSLTEDNYNNILLDENIDMLSPKTVKPLIQHILNDININLEQISILFKTQYNIIKLELLSSLMETEIFSVLNNENYDKMNELIDVLIKDENVMIRSKSRLLKQRIEK